MHTLVHGQVLRDEVHDVLEKLLERFVGDQGLADPDHDLEDPVLLPEVGRRGEPGRPRVRDRRLLEDLPEGDHGAGVGRRPRGSRSP